MGLIVKSLGPTYSSIQISTYRNVFGLIPIFLFLLFSSEWKKRNYSIKIPFSWIVIIRGGLITFAQFCFFTSLMYLEFATATTLSFATPLIVTILSIPILGQKIGKWRWIAVFLGFSGIFMIVNPSGDLFTFYALLPLGASFGYGMSMVLVKLYPREVPSALIQAYSQISSMCFSIIFLIFSFQYIQIQNFIDLIFIVLMGLLGGSGVFLIIVSYRMTNHINLGPFEYFGILFAFSLGWLIFEETPFDKLFPGVIFIVVSGLLILWREKKLLH